MLNYDIVMWDSEREEWVVGQQADNLRSAVEFAETEVGVPWFVHAEAYGSPCPCGGRGHSSFDRFRNRTIHDLLDDLLAPVELFTAHDGGDWLEWELGTEVGRQVESYLLALAPVIHATLDQDTRPMWEVAAKQCLTWAFG